MHYKNIELNNPKNIVEAFAENLSNSFAPEEMLSDASSSKDYSSSVVFNQISAQEVINAIDKLKPKCSMGSDNIPSYILKGCKDLLAPPLCKIFNISLKMGEMENTCKLIESQTGKQMIVVNGHVMVKNKNRENLYYRECKHRKHLLGSKNANNFCKARASNICTNGIPTLRKCSEHNHAPKTTEATVQEKISQLTAIAAVRQEQPARLVQVVTVDMNNVAKTDMPSKTSLKKIIKRTQNIYNPVEPHALEDILIPEELKFTLTGNLLILRESSINNHKLLLFSTEANTLKLGEAVYWIMDGTFKTAPNIFLQLYSIHAPVGHENSRVCLVYILMSRKSEAMYTRAFQDLSDVAE
ncbi:hypothetical protein CBL_12841 [Carabus blaptoides fortunei]